MWCLFIVVGLFDLYQYYRRGIFGVDFEPAWAAARALLHHRTHWSAFVYPPGCLVFVLPLALLPLHLARLIVYVVQFAGLGFTFWAVTRITRQSLGSRSVAGVACVLAVAGQIGVASNYENLTLILVPLAAAFFLALDRDRPLAAAIVLGISITIKPLLVPLLVVLILHRKWRSVAVVVLIPVVLTGMVIAVSGNPSHFVHDVLTTFGSNNAASVNMSIRGVGIILSFPVWLSAVARVVTGVACAVVCRRLWLHRFGSAGEQAIWLTAPLLVGMILCFTFAWAYYALLFLPLILATLGRRDLGSRFIQMGVVSAMLFPLLPDLTKGIPGAHPSDIIALLGLFLVLVGTFLVTEPAGSRPLAGSAPPDLTTSQ